jgi:hypothetical protein
MHIDVEGAEHRVMEGLGSLRPSMLWMETYLGKDYYGEYAYDVLELNNLVLSMGYKVAEATGSDTLYVLN